jgi:hypothetical protein
VSSIAQRLSAQPHAGDDVPTPEDAVVAEQRFLESLRRRVAWQAEAAARLRAERPPAPGPAIDVLDLAAIEQLVASRPDAPRAQEWRLFLDELRFLAEPTGRLPGIVDRLVRVVFAELLEER